MPQAFTQEDFLVETMKMVWLIVSKSDGNFIILTPLLTGDPSYVS